MNPIGSLIAMGIGFIIGFIFKRTKERWQHSSFRTVCKDLLARPHEVNLVLTTRSTKNTSVHRDEYRHVDLFEVQAYEDLSCTLRIFGIKTWLCPSTEVSNVLSLRHLFVLGRPTFNAASLQVWNSISERFTSIEFGETDKNGDPPSWMKIDKTYFRSRLDDDANVILDYCVLIRTSNPFENANSTAILAFGLHGRGTKAVTSKGAFDTIKHELKKRNIIGDFMIVLEAKFTKDKGPRFEFKEVHRPKV